MMQTSTLFFVPRLSRLLLAILALAMLGLDVTAQDDSAQSAAFDDPAWRYTFESPGENWYAPDFDASAWKEGYGGFGQDSTPGARVGTPWRTPDIWLRRNITLPKIPARPALYIHHDEDAQVYINGELVGSFEGYTSEYIVKPLSDEAAQALHEGQNTVAVHCSQTSGGQFIDVHVIDADHVPQLPLPPRPDKPFVSALITPWGEEVTAENAWTEYPRPAFARTAWTNLNGTWDYAITPGSQTATPTNWDGTILVPFCVESRLSGVQRLVDPGESLWYHRTFDYAPKPNEALLLHFEAVDYHTEVWVNGQHIGQHTGGNTPFSFDVSQAVKEGTNELVVCVQDQTGGFQLRGKQILNPHGIWYTQVSGIWQTVWLEPVPVRHLKDAKISTSPTEGTIQVSVDIAGPKEDDELVRVTARSDGRAVAQTVSNGTNLTLEIPDPQLWSPDNPHLYTLEIALVDSNGKLLDDVTSYAGIRSVGKQQDANGHWRLTLNGETVFHLGPLDQGWWPDGLLTPPSDEAMRYDIEYLKAAGFNMIRKHIKVEPRRYYYHCDQLGIMVWQDQVSGGLNPPWTRMAPNPEDATWPDADHQQYMVELERMIDLLENHPSIVMWVPFNEAWGQHRTMEVGEWTVNRDPSRLVNIASGGNFWPVGDIADHHSYPHPDFPFDASRYERFVTVVGEFGGHGLPVEGHLWDQNRDNWGYGGLPKNAEEYRDRYLESMHRLQQLKDQGIAAGVYTQTTDVEGEINGLMTYDRRVIKIPAEELKAIHTPLFK